MAPGYNPSIVFTMYTISFHSLFHTFSNFQSLGLFLCIQLATHMCNHFSHILLQQSIIYLHMYVITNCPFEYFGIFLDTVFFLIFKIFTLNKNWKGHFLNCIFFASSLKDICYNSKTNFLSKQRFRYESTKPIILKISISISGYSHAQKTL